jgi:hypothetical protein
LPEVPALSGKINEGNLARHACARASDG